MEPTIKQILHTADGIKDTPMETSCGCHDDNGERKVNDMEAEIARLTDLLDAERERCARVAEMYLRPDSLTLEECRNCGNEDDVATGAANDEARRIGATIRKGGA